MTAVNIQTQIPNSIVTVEQLLVWCVLLLSRVNTTLVVTEAENRAELAVMHGTFAAADETQRILLRAAVELDPAYLSDRSQKLWMFAREFKDTAIPASFTTN